jgi:hypothetical protein
MNLTEAERLVRRIEAYLKQPDDMLKPATMAKDYASEHQASIKRVVTCQRIIRDGDRDQAMRLAEEPPTILELINCLEFRKARDWVTLCKQNKWPTPEPMDREAVRTLQKAYAEGDKADQDFVKRYRGAVMSRNWPKAYDALQSILKVQPNDEGYQKEAVRLRKRILDMLLKPLGQAVAKGDVQRVLELSGEIESLPFQPAFTGETWPSAQTMRCGKMLADAEEYRNSDNWRKVLSVTGSVNDLIAQYGLTLPADMDGQFTDLKEWAVVEKREHDEQQKHDSLVSEVGHLLQKSEENHMASINPDLAGQTMELQMLAAKWREIEASGRSVPEELQEQYGRDTTLLRGQVSRKHRIRRNILALATVVVLVLAGVAGFFIIEAQRAGSLAGQLVTLMEERKVRASESLAKSIREKQPRLVNYAKVTAALGQVASFCKKERDANEALLVKIKGVAKWADAGFAEISPDEVQGEIDACKTALKNLADEFKGDTGSALATVENEWELHLDTQGGQRNTEFFALLASAEENVASLEYNLPPAKLAEELKRLSQPMKQMQELIPAKLKLVKIKDESVERFGLLTNKVALIRRELEAWKTGYKIMREADALEDYLDGINKIRGTKAITPKQEVALSRLLSAEIERDQLMKALLMPGLDKAWKRFTENRMLKVSPSKLMPSEETLLSKLLANLHINGMKMGKVRNITYENLRPSKGPWRSVYVYPFEDSERNSQNNGELSWANLYDSAKHPAKLRKDYHGFSFTVMDFEYITEYGSELPTSLPESKLLNRLKLSELGEGKLVSLGGVLDEIHSDTGASPVFKKYIIEILMNVIAVRPGEWDTYWLTNPSLRGYRDRLGEIDCCKNSGDWMVPDMQKKVAPKHWAKKTKAPPAKPSKLENFLMLHQKTSLEESVRLAHRIVREPYDAGFTLVGFVELDHAGDEQLSLSTPTTKRLWGWDRDGKPGRLFDWDPEKKRHKGAGNAMPFGPVYEFSGDAAAIKASLLKGNKTGHANEVVEAWFPPLYQ